MLLRPCAIPTPAFHSQLMLTMRVVVQPKVLVREQNLNVVVPFRVAEGVVVVIATVTVAALDDIITIGKHREVLGRIGGPVTDFTEVGVRRSGSSTRLVVVRTTVGMSRAGGRTESERRWSRCQIGRCLPRFGSCHAVAVTSATVLGTGCARLNEDGPLNVDQC